MNRVIRKADISDFQLEWEQLKSWCGDVNYDVLWKWSSIWRNVRDVGLLDNSFSCLDMGGGQAPLQFIFSNYGKVINIDTNQQNPISAGSLYPTGNPLVYKNENIDFRGGSFANEVTNIPDDSLDFCYDSCSLIHFGRERKDNNFYDSINATMVEVFRVLKPGGFFISACDVIHDSQDEYKELLRPKNLMALYQSTGLERYGDKPDWLLEPFFLDIKNAHVPVILRGTSPYRCHTKNQQLACCKDLPDYHLLFLHNFWRGRDCLFSRAIFTLRKPE